MPRTEVGKRLLERNLFSRSSVTDYYYTVDMEPIIDSIEAEVIEIMLRQCEAHVAAERARIRASVEALAKWDKRTVPGGFHVNRAAVLAIIDREARDATD